jgi:hypothetical protein
LGQELHILFILTIAASAIFFTYSLVRMCMNRKPKHPSSRRRHRIPSVAGPEGFKPEVPIRVHLARDEEIGTQDEAEEVVAEKIANMAAPPPAYGFWRCSVVCRI